jgi:hypothetical protein
MTQVVLSPHYNHDLADPIWVIERLATNRENHYSTNIKLREGTLLGLLDAGACCQKPRP